VLLLFSVLIFGLFFSAETVEYVKEGMNLAISCVIPSSFPFMIISDVYVTYGKPENLRLLRKAFCSLLGFSHKGLAPFICGNVGGFPIGAKMISDLYLSGELEKDDAERLLPLCNNPSCAFIVGGVGLGIYKDVRVGFILLCAVYFSTVICGILIRKERSYISISDDISRQNYSFIESVKRAGGSSISIISFISLFSVITGIIKKHVKYPPVLYVIFALIEVSGAAKYSSELVNFSPYIALSLTAFALGFGGICVGMQSSAFTLSAGLDMKKYYLIKLLEGVIASALSSVFFLLVK
jgi:hypothetical protein